MMDDTFEKVVFGAVILLIAVVFAALGFIAYGHLTQHETITIEVVDKSWHTTTTQSCTKSGDSTVCVPITTTSYQVVSSSEKFSISQALYEQVEIGKKHTFYVTGWAGARHIGRILE